MKIHFNIILPSIPRSSKWCIPLRAPQQNPVYTSRASHTYHTPRPSHSSSFDDPNNIWRRVHIINPLNPELNPICYLLALLGAHHFLHVSRIRVKLLTLRRLMSYIYIEHLFLMFLDHTQRRTLSVGLLWTSDQLVAETST